MSVAACYEGWSDAADRTDLGRSLAELALTMCPSMKTCRLTISGRASQIKSPIAKVWEQIRNIDASWTLMLLDPKRQPKDAQFLTSDPFFLLGMGKELRGFYLYGGSANALMDSPSMRMGFFSELISRVGPGLGYCTEFSDSIEAERYCLDLRTLARNQSISTFLQPQLKMTWKQSLKAAHQQHVARNLYPINVWPMYYAERLKSDEASFNCALSAGLEIADLPAGGVIATIPESSLTTAQMCLRNHLFEALPIH